ncbi:MAG TPA: hypothetical protein DDW73_14100 [Rhizobium sp.]|nr:hypothetical protein [Rhizobium sp.]
MERLHFRKHGTAAKCEPRFGRYMKPNHDRSGQRETLKVGKSEKRQRKCEMITAGKRIHSMSIMQASLISS